MTLTKLLFFKPSPTTLLLSVVTLLAFVLRVYNLPYEYGFYGDQGQDLLAVNNWFNTGVIPKVGILTSIGTFHMGPLYYYLVAPFVLLFNGDPFGPVVLFFLSGMLLVIFSFFFFKEFAGLPGAFLGAILFALSPHAIFISKGAYIPNLQILVCLVLLYFLIKFVRTNKLTYVFLAYLSIGIGVQFHYNFLGNILTASLVLLLFKGFKVVKLKVIGLALAGFLLPLLPFLIGQIYLNFEDLKGVYHYLIDSNQKGSFRFFAERLAYPFSIYFSTDNTPWYISFLAKPVFLLILIASLIISFTSSKQSLEARIILLFFLISAVLSTLMNLKFWWWYTDFYSVATLVLVCIVILYLYQYAKIKFLWLALFAVFIWWEIYNLPLVYGIGRTPQALKSIVQVIINDRKNSKALIKLVSFNPITPRQAYEHRYLLEKNGIPTEFADNIKDVDYIILESGEKFDKSIETDLNKKNYKKLQELYFQDGSRDVHFAQIYTKIK